MADKKTDRRTMKTRKAIFEGLAELLTEKELRDITVQELSDKVDIHRVTFYKHFMDIYDVYEQLEKKILSQTGLIVTECGAKTTNEIYPAVFQYVTEHPTYFKMIFSPYNTSTLYQKLLKMLEGLTRMMWSESFGVEMNDSRINSVIRYHCNGCLAIMASWVLSNFAQSEEDIIKTLAGLDNSTQKFLSAQLGK